jgi:hypothetical protein
MVRMHRGQRGLWRRLEHDLDAHELRRHMFAQAGDQPVE